MAPGDDLQEPCTAMKTRARHAPPPPPANLLSALLALLTFLAGDHDEAA
jgi:hypothetical protein